MREIKTEIEIAAPPEKIWRILTNFEGWKNWNPISNAAGSATIGSRLNISMIGRGGKEAQKYTAEITNFDQPKTFRWRAKMMAGFLFTNDKIFELQPTARGTKLVHKELFSGLMVSMFWSKFEKFVPTMLNSTNEALKKIVERT